jgi:hypothetical protein
VKPIGRTDIWLESLNLLCARHLRLHPHQRGIASADALEDRVLARSAAVMERLALKPGPQRATFRLWETSWKPEEMSRLLLEELKKRGMAVVIERDEPIESFRLPGIATDADTTLVLQASAATRRAERLREAGLLIPFAHREGLILMMSEELYEFGASQLPPAEPAPLIDQVAQHVFTRDFLGLPFNPWVADLALAGREE